MKFDECCNCGKNYEKINKRFNHQGTINKCSYCNKGYCSFCLITEIYHKGKVRYLTKPICKDCHIKLTEEGKEIE